MASTLKIDTVTTPDGTGNIAFSRPITGDGSNLTGILPAAGTSGNVLTSDGTNWASQAAAGGGAWNLIGTQVASNSASLTQTGLDSTYDSYAIAISDLLPATDSAITYMRFGDSSGIDSGAADYNWHVASWNANAEVRNDNSDSKIELGHEDGVDSTAGSLQAMLFLNTPGDGVGYHMISGTGVTGAGSGTNRYSHVFGGGYRIDATLDRVQIYFSSGNITSGRMTVWGIAHA